VSDSPKRPWRRVVLLLLIVPLAILAGLLVEHITLYLLHTAEDAIEAKQAREAERSRQ